MSYGDVTATELVRLLDDHSCLPDGAGRRHHCRCGTSLAGLGLTAHRAEVLAALFAEARARARVGVGVCSRGACRQPALALVRGWPVCGEHGEAEQEALAEAVKDVCWKATQFGTTEDGDTFAYIVPKGALHRLIGAAQGAGIPAAFRADVPAGGA